MHSVPQSDATGDASLIGDDADAGRQFKLQVLCVAATDIQHVATGQYDDVVDGPADALVPGLRPIERSAALPIYWS